VGLALAAVIYWAYKRHGSNEGKRKKQIFDASQANINNTTKPLIDEESLIHNV